MKKILMYLKGFLLCNLIVYITYLIFDSKIIPNPIDVYSALILFFSEKMYLHIFMSLGRIIAGISISLFLGGVIGYKMLYRDSLNKYLNSIILLTHPIPKTALLPIIVIIGLCDTTKIILITVVIIFQIIKAVRNSVHTIDNVCMEYILSLGASQKQVFFHVIIPKTIPGIITSIRANLGTALSILFVFEGYRTSFGMGHYVLNAWFQMDYLSMYKGIMIMSILGVLLYLCIDITEKRLVKWK